MGFQQVSMFCTEDLADKYRYLTLFADPSVGTQKTPRPLTQIGNTPLRDLVLAETYGAAVDARGDCWMWGKGYNSENGAVGRSLKGKACSSLDSRVCD